MNYRIFIEKKIGFDIHSQEAKQQLESLNLDEVKVILIYDIFHVSKAQLETIVNEVLTDSVVDTVHYNYETRKPHFAIEYLPGQYDQRADSAMQCAGLVLDNANEIVIQTAKLVILPNANNEQISAAKGILINAVESREKDLSQIEIPKYKVAGKVPEVEGFRQFTADKLESFLKENGLSMDMDDLIFIQEYFVSQEKRDPKITEIKVLDTYWSDHCRHTTFETELTDVQITGRFKTYIEEAFTIYTNMRNELGISKPMRLMDLATIVGKYFIKKGEITNVEVSEEVNACSIEVEVDVDGTDETWLYMFKNETHNHPTEIDPFGGASTCIGGAIRDPLSGRAFVYQAMRVTGSADPHESIEDTMEGKLPQKKITKEAAHGYSSYGNQIGISTTHISEVYHQGYKAKRMEVGFVAGAVPKDWVRRESPIAGDIVLLLGGKTGRDGVGGATGSSKVQEYGQLQELSAEVQKGNAIVERKIQRLFRNEEVIKMIKKSNDFGAGGVSVAIGEIARGIDINLDNVPLKYAGLNGSELALSESQERMAIVVSPVDVERMQELALKENLEAIHIAEVTDLDRLVMNWQGNAIVDIDRKFLDTNGVRKKMDVVIADHYSVNPFAELDHMDFEQRLSCLAVTSQKGLVQMFDSSVGKSTVLWPLGGKNQLSPEDVSAQLFPVLGNTKTVSLASWGFHPKVSAWSTYHGGIYAVLESITKLVAAGGKVEDIHFSFQEYFERLGKDAEKWGKPLAALLGTTWVLNHFKRAAIGGKDSMSGTYKDIHVPPTLISFAVCPSEQDRIVSATLSGNRSNLYLARVCMNEDFIPDLNRTETLYDLYSELVDQGKILSAKTIKDGGIAASVFKMAVGNDVKFEIKHKKIDDLLLGSWVFETQEDLDEELFEKIGTTEKSADTVSINDKKYNYSQLKESYTKGLENIFKTNTEEKTNSAISSLVTANTWKAPSIKQAKPKISIPVFPGTNSEYDSTLSMNWVGGLANQLVFSNQNYDQINRSVDALAKSIDESQIFFIPGGFSSADEPDGSAKFIVSVLKNEKIKNSIEGLLSRDGLILGICNGFQALVKSGLLPYGKIATLEENAPTLTFNEIGRHASQMVTVRVTSNQSPWMKSYKPGTLFTLPVSHGEGRFYCTDEVAKELHKNGQIATQYVDSEGQPSLNIPYNPNGSVHAIEGVYSPCGKIYGRMGHPERYRAGLMKNIPNANYHNIFKNGIEYFK